MKKIIDRLSKAGKALDDAIVMGPPIQLEPPPRPPKENRASERRTGDRRHIERREHDEELVRLWHRVEQNSRNLEVQLVRIAQLQAELDLIRHNLRAAMAEDPKPRRRRSK